MDQESTIDRENKEKHGLLRGLFKSREAGLFKSSEIDIYTNRVTNEAWIFHSPPISLEIAKVEYNHKTRRMTFITEGGQRHDLGVKIQPLIRPTIEKISKIVVTQLTDGMPVSWFSAPVRHIEAKEEMLPDQTQTANP